MKELSLHGKMLVVLFHTWVKTKLTSFLSLWKSFLILYLFILLIYLNYSSWRIIVDSRTLCLILEWVWFSTHDICTHVLLFALQRKDRNYFFHGVCKYIFWVLFYNFDHSRSNQKYISNSFCDWRAGQPIKLFIHFRIRFCDWSFNDRDKRTSTINKRDWSVKNFRAHYIQWFMMLILGHQRVRIHAVRMVSKCFL